MAILIQTQTVYQAWTQAANYLQVQKHQEATNLILCISDPAMIFGSEHLKIHQISTLLNKVNSKTSISTVANTIFPQQLYTRFGRPQFYQEFHNVFSRAKEQGTWGTYFERMTRFNSHKSLQPINQIELAIHKLTKDIKYKATYEISIIDPCVDYNIDGAEICTYDPMRFGKVQRNLPCLSHISFKLIDSKINLTAVYRSHHYMAKALGNLIGLSQLLSFIAQETGFAVGELTCVSTYALFDWQSLGDKSAFNDICSEQSSCQ